MLAATADEFLLLFRADVGDDDGYTADNDDTMLWKDAEIYRYMTVAADRVLKDTESQHKLLRLAYTADSPYVPLPRYVGDIRELRDTTLNRKIDPANANSVDAWRTGDYGAFGDAQDAMFNGSGQPTQYVRDYEKKALRLVPIPNTSGTLEIQCSVTLQLAMQSGDPMPVQDIDEQQLMLEYMKYLAYRKHDAETEDLVRSEKAKAAYDRGARERKSELRRNRRTPGVVRMSGWND